MRSNMEIKNEKNFYEKHIKVPQDFFLALIALIVLSPILLIVAILVRVKLGSPVIFKQERPGLNGNIFEIYKFRTMSNKKNSNGDLLSDEQRLEKFGKTLRSLSIDELPAIINILRLEMSWVGPRPLLPQYLSRYNKYQARRHEVRPGITGYAQVNGRNSINWEQKFNYDVQYIDNITFFGDLKIMFQTVGKVIKRDGISSNISVTMEEFMGTEENNSDNK